MSVERRRALLLDLLLLAAAVGEVSQVVEWGDPGDIGTPLAVLSVVGLLVRRRLPLVAFLTALPAFTLFTATIPLLIALFSVAAESRRKWVPIAAAGITLLASYRLDWVLPDPSSSGPLLAFALLYSGGPLALGLLVRTRRELSDRVSELMQARHLERARDREYVLQAERSRISREMHDVVSHQVSLIAVQAGALQVRTADAQSRETARTIRALAVRTLEELRQMVGVLRAEAASQRLLVPQPTIADLPELIAHSESVTISEIDLPDSLAPALQRAIYRTVQEGLTNARKHAPGAPVQISVSMSGSCVEVRVRSGIGDGGSLGLPSSGTGLLGLRERAELIGGTLRTQQDSNGFLLALSVPL